MAPEHRLCIPDEHFSRIVDLLKSQKSVKLKDNRGIETKFYYHGDGTLMADRWDDNVLVQQEVMKMSEIPEIQQAVNTRPLKENLIFKIKEDFPELTDEELESYADTFLEANESIKRLVESGMDRSTAIRIVEDIMSDDNLIKFVEKEDTNNSAYALAEVLRDRERLFGPKHNNNSDKTEDV